MAHDTETAKSTQTLYPALRYRDARAAIDWLVNAFGFEEGMVVEGEERPIVHAQLTFRGAMIMLGSEPKAEDRYGRHAGNTWLYIAVDDPDDLCRRAVDAGAELVQDLTDTDYGSRDFSVRDPEGNLWSFGTYRP